MTNPSNSGKPAAFSPGDKAYLIESNRIIREGRIVRKCGGGMYIFGFLEGGGIRVPGSRLYASPEAAKESLGTREKKKVRKSTMYIPED